MNISEHLEAFEFIRGAKTKLENIKTESGEFRRFVNEYWTAQQRQGHSLHEVSYRACFKPQLPNFFINLLTKEGDTVYDPFLGRGTAIVEAALMNRRVIGNDINPLSRIFTEARLFIPKLTKVEERLHMIDLKQATKFNPELSVFYHNNTERELASLSRYLHEKYETGTEDALDKWIRMVATNRLTGHSKGFFSVYTLPPNQATSIKRQIKINEKRDQVPEYRDVKALILKKSASLIRNITPDDLLSLRKAGEDAVFLTNDARYTPEIKDETVRLTITSPPFLDIVQYAEDNWLRCLFNGLDAKEIEKKMTLSRTQEEWTSVMQDVFHELFRITQKGGYVAFEVGEVHGGKIKLDEPVIPLGINSGFRCEGVLVNKQDFTKTANIWGISNNKKGTNSNRVVIFSK